MITLKDNLVKIKVLSPALGYIFYKLTIFHDEKMSPHPENLVITSINDGVHMQGSKHYTDEAIDLRSKNFEIDEQKVEFALRFQDYLGPKFRVLLENYAGENEHFHVQVRRGMKF